MTQLDDGVYDAIVIDAKEIDDHLMHIDLALTSGARKGEIVQVSARHLQRAWTDLLGLPATITVIDGQPRVQFE